MTGGAGHDGIAAMFPTGHIRVAVPTVASCCGANRVAIQTEQAVGGSGTGVVGGQPVKRRAGAGAIVGSGGIRPRLVGAG